MACTAKDIVLQRFSTAYADDDGVAVYIRTTRTIKDTCPTCKQEWFHKIPDFTGGTLASAGNAETAWQNAAENLNLIPAPLS